MKAIILSFITILLCATVSAQDSTAKVAVPDQSKKIIIAEASCGQCKFGLPGTDCDLAVRIDGKAYYVDGTKIDEHGDAHATDGFCNAIRKAQVQGTVVNNRFQATYFKLLPAAAKQ